MRQAEYNKYRELCLNIEQALSDAYPEDSPVEYEFAVNPATYEVMVVFDYLDTPEGWIYESITDAEWDTICRCAEQYFDFRS